MISDEFRDFTRISKLINLFNRYITHNKNKNIISEPVKHSACHYTNAI